MVVVTVLLFDTGDLIRGGCIVALLLAGFWEI